MILRRTQLAGVFCGWLLLSCLAWAQTTQTSPTALKDILALEDPTARLTALQQFLKTNTTGEAALNAREAVVASYAQLGETQLNENNIEKAVDAFQKAVKALPKQVSTQFFEDTVIKIPLAVSTRGYRAEAVALGKLLETRFANESERLAALGEYYLSIEASGEAINTLENAARLAPEDARLHRALGAAYRMGLRIGDAVAAYQLAVRYDPKDRRAFYDLANLYRSQGAYDDALKLYKKQLEIDPKHTASFKGLALAYTALGKETEAAAALNQVRDLRGSSDEIRQDILLQTQLAFYYLGQGKLKAAREASDAALLVEPRFSWARLAAAEVEMAEGKYFEAERHLLAAQQYANFPTLAFTLAKLYLIVEDFDGASDLLTKAFSYNTRDKFTTRLGGVREVQADELRDLLAPEHQAAIFLADPPTNDELFKIAEALTRVNARLKEAGKEAGKDAGKETIKENNEDRLEQSARTFVEAEGTRRSFRALYMARRLAQAGKLLELSTRFADQALELAEVATEAEGSLRDFPNYDREGRLRTFRGRAYDARGWALFKAGRYKDAVQALSQAVQTYGPLPEGKEALRHLSAAKEALGDTQTALEMALAAYEPPASKSGVDVNRTLVELLYRKVHGSLNGLAEQLGRPLSAKTREQIAANAAVVMAKAPSAESQAANSANTSAEQPAAKAEFNVNQLLVNRANETRPSGTEGEKRPGLNAAPRRDERTATANNTTAEPLRLGQYGIPVNPKSAPGSARPTPPLNTPKPQPRNVDAPPVNAAAVKPPVVTNTVKEPVKEVASHVKEPVKEPVKELVKDKEPVKEPVNTEVAEVARALPKESAAPPATAVVPEPVAAKPREPVAEKPVLTPPSTPLTVPEINPVKPAEKPVEAPLVSLPVFPAVVVVLTAPTVPRAAPPALVIEAVEDTPVPANVTAAVEPAVTVQYEPTPAAKTGETAMPAEPPAPVSTRPRRVSELVPVNQPVGQPVKQPVANQAGNQSGANTRKRRVSAKP